MALTTYVGRPGRITSASLRCRSSLVRAGFHHGAILLQHERSASAARRISKAARSASNRGYTVDHRRVGRAASFSNEHGRRSQTRSLGCCRGMSMWRSLRRRSNVRRSREGARLLRPRLGRGAKLAAAIGRADGASGRRALDRRTPSGWDSSRWRGMAITRSITCWSSRMRCWKAHPDLAAADVRGLRRREAALSRAPGQTMRLPRRPKPIACYRRVLEITGRRSIALWQSRPNRADAGSTGPLRQRNRESSPVRLAVEELFAPGTAELNGLSRRRCGRQHHHT